MDNSGDFFGLDLFSPIDPEYVPYYNTSFDLTIDNSITPPQYEDLSIVESFFTDQGTTDAIGAYDALATIFKN